MIWVTITTYKSEFPIYSWYKHDYVIKTILFSLFIPFIIDTRVKFDTFIAILICSISFYTIALGMKSAVGGGGYGQVLIQTRSTNAGMSESSTMSMVAVLNISFIVYVAKYSVFHERVKFLNVTSKLLIFASLMSILGTFARTGLVGLFTWLGLQLQRSKHKSRFLLLIIITIVIALPFVPSTWLERMASITNPTEESSAYGRIVVWKWTLDYAAENPILGGGFNAFLANAGQLDKYIDEDMYVGATKSGKATHNIFMQVLSEHGYVGLLIFLLIILHAYLITRKLQKSQNTENWIKYASIAIKDS